jgi:hypothetical protein
MTAEEHPTRSRFARRKRAAMAQVVADTHALSAWYACELNQAKAYVAEAQFWRTSAICVGIFTGVMVAGTIYLLVSL